MKKIVHEKEERKKKFYTDIKSEKSAVKILII